jgi:hypothetical protein
MSIEGWNKLSKSEREFVVATLGEAITSTGTPGSAYPPQFGSGLFSRKDALAPFHTAISALKELSEKQCE